MIRAVFTKRLNGYRLRIEGHANYGKTGEDIVCSSVSGIFYALCAYLLNFKRENLKVNAIESGLADIECGEEGEGAMQMACLGLWQISCQYPEHVAVEIGAWRWRMNPPIFKMEYPRGSAQT